MKVILNDERILIVNPTIVKMFGSNEAFFLQQLHYWLQKSQNVVDGKLWVYHSFEEWTQEISFLSGRTIQRIVQRLQEHGVIEVSHHGKGRFDQTNWYTLNYERLMQLVAEYRAKNGVIKAKESIVDDEVSFCPTPDKVALSTVTAEPVCPNGTVQTDEMKKDETASSITSAFPQEESQSVADHNDKMALSDNSAIPAPTPENFAQNGGMDKDNLSSPATSACRGEVRHAVVATYDTVSSSIQKNITENTSKMTSESLSEMRAEGRSVSKDSPDAPYRRLCALFSRVHHPITGNEAKELRRFYQARGETATELAILRSEGAHKPLRYMAAVLKNLTDEEIAAFVTEKKGDDFHGSIGVGRQRVSRVSRQGQRASRQASCDNAKYYTSVPW